MKKIKTIILRTAGTNCDKETAHAFELAGSSADLVHINELKKNKKLLDKYQILAIPGGFTYGDDIASGRVLANELKYSLKSQLSKFVSRGKLVIGICNGFQVLVKMGFLPNISGKKDYDVDATLSLNDSGKFIAKWVYLSTSHESQATSHDKCVWTKKLPEVIYIPIAHAEGKFITKDEKVLKKLKDNGQIVFRYTDESGTKFGKPYTPNGSVYDIAGVCDTTGQILGLMPHPERHVTYLQHPNWRRNTDILKKFGTGLEVFKNGVNFAKNNL